MVQGTPARPAEPTAEPQWFDHRSDSAYERGSMRVKRCSVRLRTDWSVSSGFDDSPGARFGYGRVGIW